MMQLMQNHDQRTEQLQQEIQQQNDQIRKQSQQICQQNDQMQCILKHFNLKSLMPGLTTSSDDTEDHVNDARLD